MSSSWWDKVTKERMARRRLLQMAGTGGAAITAATLIGCGGSDSGSSGSTTSSVVKARKPTGPLAAKQELKVRFYDDPGGFDPATIFRIEVENIGFNVFSGLTSYEPDNAKIIPDLAESWETPDPTTSTFKLRKGVKFHKGFGDFTAQTWSTATSGSWTRDGVQLPRGVQQRRFDCRARTTSASTIKLKTPGRELPAPGRQLPPGSDRQPRFGREVRCGLQVQPDRHGPIRVR